MSDLAQGIYDRLESLPKRRSLDALLGLFDALGYQYADELPLPVRIWPDGVRDLVQESAETPIYLAEHRDFRVVYTQLTTDELLRTIERPIVEQTLRKIHPYGLFVFSNRDLTQWDFVNVKYAAEDDGDRRRTIRRIHVGPTERLHTAAQRISMLAVPDFDTTTLELQSLHDQAFDVEEVTQQFYHDYVDAFGALSDDIAAHNPNLAEKTEAEAQLLLDRLLFLYFIQKKGWLDGKQNYLYEHFQAYDQTDPAGASFYDDFLFPLFVALSNDDMVLPSLGNVPFLNGGLFEVPADAPLPDQLTVSNAVFRQIFGDLLERYNFTVREDTPLDVEVAIDPEMLGQIFENLVLGLERGEDLRKLTGSYYTPRVIVHFMCREVLTEYLSTESDIESEHLETLIGVGPAEQLTPELLEKLNEMLTKPEARLLRGLLTKMRVLDPAVGSGAFIVGMLYEMVALTKLLDVRLYGQQRVRLRNYDYNLKRSFIEHNLYGVDIQPEAVRICELRLWLSLMVDYEREADERVPTLPNLSYRIRVGDSLVERLFGEPVQLDELVDDAQARQLIDRIQAEKQAYFLEQDLWEKQRRELRILGMLCELAAKLVGAKRGAVLTQMSAEVPPMGDAFMSRAQRKLKEELESELERYSDLMERVKAVHSRVKAIEDVEVPIEAYSVDALRTQLGLSFIWRLDFAEVFSDMGGFSVIIGNPPYVRLQSIDQEERELYKELYQSATWNYDLYVIFTERAWQLLARNGQFCFIQPNKFMQARYGRGLRKLLADRKAVRAIVDFGAEQVFSTATNYTCLLFLNREVNESFRYTEVSNLAAWQDRGQAERGQIDAQTMTARPWNFVVGTEAPLFRRLREMPTKLRDLASIFVGLQTSADRVYVLEEIAPPKGGTVRVKDTDDVEWSLELEVLKPFLKKVTVSTYEKPIANHWLIFPYRIRGKRATLIPATEMSSSYPGVWEYLNRNSGILRGRESGKADHEGWYGYIYKKNLTLFNNPKLIVQVISLFGRYAYDASGLYFTGGGNGPYYGIQLPDTEIPYSIHYLQGLLSSPLLDFYLYQVSSPLRGGYWSYGKRFIEQLPIRTIDFDDPVDVTRHDKMVDLVKQMLKSHAELESTHGEEKASVERQIAATDSQINTLVYELYELTEEEISVVRDSFRRKNH